MHVILMIFIVLLVYPVDSTLTGSGSLCAGQTALFTCNVTGGITVLWRYVTDAGDSPIGELLNPTSGPTSTDTVGGVLFTVTLLMPTRPHLVTQLNFTASANMNGGVVLCSTTTSSTSSENITLEVENVSKYLGTSVGENDE